MEEVFGGLPRLTEKEHMWFSQLDEDGLPEVMDEEMEEATIKELQRLAVATGKRLNVSQLLVYSWQALHRVVNISAFSVQELIKLFDVKNNFLRMILPR